MMAKPDETLDQFIEAAARALSLPIEPEWKPAIRANLEMTLKHATLVDEFPLPDAAEPAPVFKA
jgi:1-carboxybiuret hydrolase subunit AtzG-like protein